MVIKVYAAAAAATAKSLQSCLTLCDPINGSPPGSPVPGILQARTLEWVAISLSNAWKWKVKVKSLSRVQLLATPWTTAHQALRPWDFQARVLEWGAIAFSNILWKNPNEIFGQLNTTERRIDKILPNLNGGRLWETVGSQGENKVLWQRLHPAPS